MEMGLEESVVSGLIFGIVAGVVVYTLQVIWDIRKDYLILMDRVKELEIKVDKLNDKINQEDKP